MALSYNIYLCEDEKSILLAGSTILAPLMSQHSLVSDGKSNNAAAVQIQAGQERKSAVGLGPMYPIGSL